jgi:phosphonatase-like hydrolase
MSDLRLAVLDMAGTTVKDHGQVPRAFETALSEIGIDVSRAEIEAVRGSSKREAVRQFIPAGPDRDRLSALVYESFRRHLAHLYDSGGVSAIEGAESAFDWFRTRGVRVVLNTGFDRDITTLLLTALQWDARVIDAVVCGDDVAKGRPAPDLILAAMERTGISDPRCVLNAGDTVLDLRAAHTAGVRWNVGVLSGAHDRRTLESAPHTHLVQSIADLPEALREFVRMCT